MARTRFQRFQMATIQRSQINEAPYNPRIMDAFAATRLRDNLKRLGLVEPLIWNKRSGNLLSGHQRLGQIDRLEKKKDYSLNLAVVDLDEKAEKEMNVFLNNQSVQGDWDLPKLKAMLEGVDLERTGFTRFDVQLVFEDSGMSPFFAENAAQAAVVADGERTFGSYADERADRAKKRRERAYGGDPNFDPEFFAVITFDSDQQRAELFALLNIDPPPSAVIDGRVMEKFIESQV